MSVFKFTLRSKKNNFIRLKTSKYVKNLILDI